MWALHNEMAMRCAGTPDFHETGPLGADWLKLWNRNLPSVPEYNLYLKPEIRSTATNCMPEVVSDLSFDFKKTLELRPQVAS